MACIERAVDMLRTSELYSPQMRDEPKLRVEDPIATDLIGALLSVSILFDVVVLYVLTKYLVLICNLDTIIYRYTYGKQLCTYVYTRIYVINRFGND